MIILLVIFLHCIPDQILSTKCAKGFHEIRAVSKLWGVKKGQLFYFWSNFKNDFFIGILMKIPGSIFQTDFLWFLRFPSY